jgi:hypothetical protein
MGSLDLPAWIQAGTGVANLFLGLGSRRQAQARDWGEALEELAGLEREELRRIVEDNPAVAEIVGDAWEEAARTASDNKRYLLARVAAAALRGDTIPGQVDVLQLLLRTVIDLDSTHVALLVSLSTTKDGKPRPAVEDQEDMVPDGASPTREEVVAKWPSPPDLLNPALSTLEREGLIQRLIGLGGEGRLGYALTPYGRRFLDHLLIDEAGWPPEQAIESPAPSPPAPVS